MTLTKSLLIMVAIIVLGTGCSAIQNITSSPQFIKFCEWQSLAVVAIEGASVEALKDPRKQKVGAALAETVNYLRMASASCPKAT
jgi:hypothetical protein